jgi:transcriptional regulator with XRE-family HTH domain
VERNGAEKPEPQREEVETLLRLIDDEILRSRISKRQLERILGQGQGYIGSLLKGRITLKVGHVYEIGQALGLDPLLLFFRAAPRENQERLLQELSLHPPPQDNPAEPPPAMTRQEIEELVRKVVRQELARLATA